MIRLENARFPITIHTYTWQLLAAHPDVLYPLMSVQPLALWWVLWPKLAEADVAVFCCLVRLHAFESKLVKPQLLPAFPLSDEVAMYTALQQEKADDICHLWRIACSVHIHVTLVEKGNDVVSQQYLCSGAWNVHARKICLQRILS